MDNVVKPPVADTEVVAFFLEQLGTGFEKSLSESETDSGGHTCQK